MACCWNYVIPPLRVSDFFFSNIPRVIKTKKGQRKVEMTNAFERKKYGENKLNRKASTYRLANINSAATAKQQLLMRVFIFFISKDRKEREKHAVKRWS